MQVTDPGIDWNRVDPDEIDGLSARVMSAGKSAPRSGVEGDLPEFSRVGRVAVGFRTIGGEWVNLTAARGQLHKETAVLANSLGTALKDAMAAHVSEVPAVNVDGTRFRVCAWSGCDHSGYYTAGLCPAHHSEAVDGGRDYQEAAYSGLFPTAREYHNCLVGGTMLLADRKTLKNITPEDCPGHPAPVSA